MFVPTALEQRDALYDTTTYVCYAPPFPRNNLTPCSSQSQATWQFVGWYLYGGQGIVPQWLRGNQFLNLSSIFS